MHGSMTNRWGSHFDSQFAVERLAAPLPERVGEWKLRREPILEEAVIRLLQCPAYISRIYEHEQSGNIVSVAVLLGPPGPISVHTPEICYSSHNFQASRERRLTCIQDAKGNDHTFWEVTMTSSGLENATQRVLYAWSTGSHWKAAEYPRFKYGGVSHLYKLQLATAANGKNESAEESDSTDTFLAEFLAQLSEQLVASRSNTSSHIDPKL